MKGVLKFLLLLSTVHLAISVPLNLKGLPTDDDDKKFTCPEGQYNYKNSGACFKCTDCSEFLYVKEKCSEFSNTVCGWCGKEPNYSEISDEVMASYQTKCLMSRLDFVDMSKLEKELLEEEDAAALEDSGSIDDEELVMWKLRRAEEEDRLEDVSDELEGRVPNYDSEEKEEDKSDSAESSSESDSSQEDQMNDDKTVEEKVHAYLIQKSEKVVKKVPLEPKNPFINDDATIVSREEVEASLKHLVQLIPVQRIVMYNGEEMVDSSSEDSNERDIKWDRWVDDEVKPIREYVRRVDSDVEEVEAEETPEETRERIVIFARKLYEQNHPESFEEHNYSFTPTLIRFFMRLTIFVVGLAVLYKIFLKIRLNRAERRQFQGVPIDCQDYHMIIDASRYVEELEKKEAKASKHIHENPAFDI